MSEEPSEIWEWVSVVIRWIKNAVMDTGDSGEGMPSGQSGV